MSGGSATGSALEFRSASESDLADEYAVFAAAREELHTRRGDAWSAPIKVPM